MFFAPSSTFGMLCNPPPQKFFAPSFTFGMLYNPPQWGVTQHAKREQRSKEHSPFSRNVQTLDRLKFA